MNFPDRLTTPFSINTGNILALDDSFTKESAISVKNLHPSSDTIAEIVQTVDRKVKDCLPVQHLAFLPMRQTKSFLLQAIFVHFGLKNHLRYILQAVRKQQLTIDLVSPYQQHQMVVFEMALDIHSPQ